MSIKSALESEGIDFSEYMNPPEPWNGQALIRNINGTKYACCPFCQKKALLISPNTKIQHLKLKCKGSNCKKEFEVNVWTQNGLNVFWQVDASSKVRIQNRNAMIKKRLAPLQKLATNVGRSTLPYLPTNN